MNSIQLAEYRGYKNVMEFLVAEEVDRQLSKLPPKLAMYIRSLEVETYALNRLPSLYASSERGWRYQRMKAEKEFQKNIATGVRQAFSAVQADPIRCSNPLSSSEKDDSQENEESQTALQEIRDLLQQPDLSWTGAVEEIKKLVKEKNRSSRRAIWRPGTYGMNSIQSRPPGRQEDWNDPLYSQ
ncbi:MAG: late competence development ComFB family protein [Leptolyngbyaceae cyanobacterium MO_188.B28]|nr:late competence development ComFB family protein [Leptolyngbyaceae cyanobacterium MO_188.B28]